MHMDVHFRGERHDVASPRPRYFRWKEVASGKFIGVPFDVHGRTNAAGAWMRRSCLLVTFLWVKQRKVTRHQAKPEI